MAEEDGQWARCTRASWSCPLCARNDYSRVWLVRTLVLSDAAMMRMLLRAVCTATRSSSCAARRPPSSCALRSSSTVLSTTHCGCLPLTTVHSSGRTASYMVRGGTGCTTTSCSLLSAAQAAATAVVVVPID